MVKKAEDLRSLDDLGLSNQVQRYVRRKAEDDLLGAVLRGRLIYVLHKERPNAPEYRRISDLRLIGALNSEGFIRRDIDSGSFRINLLYRTIYPEIRYSLSSPISIEELCQTSRGLLEANRRYEAFQNPTEGLVRLVKNDLRRRLNDEEYFVMVNLFGLEDGKLCSLERVGERMCLTRQRIFQIKTAALQKMRGGNDLPPI